MEIVSPRTQTNTTDIVITRIREHGPRHKVEQLCLDEIPLMTLSSNISSLLQKCRALEYISICSCQLSSLQSMPYLPNLQILQLSNNQLTSGNVESLAKYSKLYQLALDSNCIENYTWAKYLKKSRITLIYLKENPIAEDEDYREKVYKAMGSDLEVLDGMDRAGRQVSQSQSYLSGSGQGSQDDQYSQMKEQQEKQVHSEKVSIQQRGIQAHESELLEKQINQQEQHQPTF